MRDPKKFKVQLIVGFFCYIGGMALLAWLAGDSRIVGIIAILGWIVLVLYFVRYVALHRKGREPRGP